MYLLLLQFGFHNGFDSILNNAIAECYTKCKATYILYLISCVLINTISFHPTTTANRMFRKVPLI